MKRIAVAIAALTLLVVPVAHVARAAGGSSLPDVYQVRAEVGGMHDSIAVPAYFEMFFPYSMSEASNDSTHGLHAPWYGGFFLTAAAQFYGFPPFPGTTETLYPQGPEDARVEFLPLPGGGWWESAGHSTARSSNGSVTYGTSESSSPFGMTSGTSRSAVSAAGGAITATAASVMEGVRFADGALTIGAVEVNGRAVSTGRPGGSKAEGDLSLVDVELAGVPLRVTPTGVEIAGTGGDASNATVDELFAAAGISMRRLPDRRVTTSDGTSSLLEIGGVEVVVAQPEQEVAVTYTLGRLRLSSRSAYTAGGDGSGPPVLDDLDDPIVDDPFFPPDVLSGTETSGNGTGGVAAGPSLRPRTEHGAADVALPTPTRAIRRVTPASAGNWSGIGALLLLVTPGGLVVRRTLRAANRS